MSAIRPADLERLSQLTSSGQFAQALEFVRKLVRRHPASSFAWNALGALLGQLGENAGAIEALERAARMAPSDGAVQKNLGGAYALAGRLEDSARAFQNALRLNPMDAGSYLGMGQVLAMRDMLPVAAQFYRTAVQCDPDLHIAWRGLGTVLMTMGEIGESERSLRRALALAPGVAENHQMLGNLLAMLGRMEEARESLRECLAIDPAHLAARSNLLFLRQYVAPGPAGEELGEALAFARLARERARPYGSWNCAADARPLRVGFVSGDLRSHPVGYFLEGMLSHLDPGRIEVLAYSTSHMEDALTQRIRARFARWTTIAEMSDGQAAARIHGDAPHVLIDLSGHTAMNRLALFAWRPAPVQVSWLGYVATTGMPEIDYLLADPLTVPPGTEDLYVERIWRLAQTRFCFTPPAQDIEVSPLPALAKGHVTFGCFNTLAKLQDGVLQAWGRILREVPGSRLRLMARQLGDADVRSSLAARLDRAGIDAERFDLLGALPRGGYLAAYHAIDIALDPFPFTGGTTTAEALWMGVPVLTLDGVRLVERQGVGLLRCAGLSGWIARDPDDYVRRAVRLAGDPGELSRLRARLRGEVLASPVCNAADFAREFTGALLGMWDEHPRGAAPVAGDRSISPAIAS